MGFFSDIGNAIAGAVSTVANVVEDTVDAATEVLEDAADAVIQTVQNGVTGLADTLDSYGDTGFMGGGGGVGGFLVNVFGGILNGTADLVGDVLGIAADLFTSSIHIASSILRLDFAGVLNELGDILLNAVNGVLVVTRFLTGGYFAGGIIKMFQRQKLRHFVSDLIDTNFGGDEELRNTIRENIGLSGKRSFGLRMIGDHKVLVLDSASVNLVAMHNSGAINLYEAAGLGSFGASVNPNARYKVKSVNFDGSEEGVDSWFPVDRLTIYNFLKTGGISSRLRVYALNKEVSAQNINICSERFKAMGINIDWKQSKRFSRFSKYDAIPISAAEYMFNLNAAETFLVDRGLRTGTQEDDRTILAICAHRFMPDGSGSEAFGEAFGISIAPFPGTGCSTPGRTDGCCVSVTRQPGNGEAQGIGAGAFYRDVNLNWIFQYVLTHEIGHCMGLCHFLHSANEIMWTAAPGAGTSTINSGILAAWYDSKPRFTYRDGENCWRHIVSELPHLLIEDPDSDN